MSRISVAYFHAGATRDATGAWRLPAEVEERYRAGVAPHELVLHCEVAGQGYPAYARRAAELRATSGGSLWRAIRAMLPAADVYGVAGFSAGGELVRELLTPEDAERDRELGFVCSLDASYAGEPAPGVPLATDIAPWVRAAARARASGPILVMGASEVDPVAYASTDEVLRAIAAANAIERHQFAPHLGAGPHALVSEAEGLGVLLRWYAGRDQAGHSAALIEWGPELVGEAVRRALARLQAPTDRPPPTLPSGDAILVREGERGDRVRAVQRAVGATADGVWGPLTTRCVGVWLAAARLPVVPWWSAAAQAVAEAQGAPPLPVEARRRRMVDVSEAQGTVDWVAARAAGVELAYARATYGTYVDRQFAANWSAMRGAGIERGAYGVVLPESMPGAASIEQQAQALARATGALGDGDLASACDVEPPGAYASSTAGILRWQRELTAEQLVRYAEVIARETGREELCYTSPGLWVWGDCLSRRGVRLWCADARGASLAAGAPVSLPAGWDTWQIWQRGVAPLPGEPAAVDDDVWRGKA